MSDEKRAAPLLGEAHRRALERIGDPNLRQAAAVEMAYRGVTPSAADAYVTAVLHPDVPAAVRGFLMAVETALPAGCEYIREDADNCVKVTLRCPY